MIYTIGLLREVNNNIHVHGWYTTGCNCILTGDYQQILDNLRKQEGWNEEEFLRINPPEKKNQCICTPETMNFFDFRRGIEVDT